jgi:hypothetical protein
VWGVSHEDESVSYPVVNKNRNNHTASTAFKLFAVLAAIWLLNVVFVAVHESGHCVTATASGANIIGVYISPLGLEGATTHTQVTDQANVNIVLAAGVVTTTLAIIVAYFARLEIAVYVIGLRTIESVINYSPGSDMQCLLANIGTDAYLLSAVLLLVSGLFVGLMFRKRVNIGMEHKRIAAATRRSSAQPPALAA